MKLVLFFEIPVLCTVEVPVEHQGEVPLLKLPSLMPHTLRVERIGLSSADIILEIEVENPNVFSFEAPCSGTGF